MAESEVRVVRCGFRTRRRVQGARALLRALTPRALWESLFASWESHGEQMDFEDRQRACPHPVAWCYQPDTWTKGAICDACSAGVPWRPGTHKGRPR
jgi:hypothetical protein